MPLLSALVERAGALADRPGTSDEQLLKNRFLVLTGLGMSFGGIGWGGMLGALGLWWQAVVPFSYTVITALNFGYLYRTGAFRLAANVQVGISILLPFALQWSLGGFVASGGTMVWAFVSTIAAQSLSAEGRPTAWWLLATALIVVSALLEPSLPVPELFRDPLVSTVAFVVNFTVVGSLLFALTGYFLHLQHRWGLELAEKNRQIAESQQALVQAEKLAAVGRLSAGLAHEMNNPAAAVGRGASHLRHAVDELWRLRFDLGRAGLDADQLARVADLEADVQSRVLVANDLGALERANRERAIEEWIDDHSLNGGSDAWSLVECGFTPDELDDLAAVFDQTLLTLVLRQHCAWQTTVSLIQELGLGAGRISTLVNALKSYTYLDQARVQSVDVNEGLQNTLIMLRGALKQGVTVHQDLAPDLPRIEASGGELNQVWTSLIDNAISAMDGEGDLEVHTVREDGEIVVRIVDSGPGVPEAIRDRLFDPFVTTKPVGEGTGLGLNISRNIVVEKHGGTIGFESRPGRTCFEVRLPIRPAERLQPA
jgi:signal transduction histidine kinase